MQEEGGQPLSAAPLANLHRGCPHRGGTILAGWPAAVAVWKALRRSRVEKELAAVAVAGGEQLARVCVDGMVRLARIHCVQ